MIYKIIIVTVFNNIELYNQMKESVLSCSENIAIEFYGLDNTNNKYKSATRAYNEAITHLQNVKEDVAIVFCHQDVIFYGNCINRIIDVCNKEPNTLFGVAGVQNCKHGGANNKNRIISSISMINIEGKYKTLESNNLKEVFTLDEVLIACNNKLLSRIQFDEQTCDGWHLYAADLSMQCHLKGIPVKVFDSNIIHLSGGNPDKNFYNCEKRLAKKYKKNWQYISYTCGWTYTNPLMFWILRLYRKNRYKIY